MTSPMTGLWWLPQDTKHRVSGTLEQAPDGKFTLQTYTGLEGGTPFLGEQDVHGLVNGVKTTIRNAQWWGAEGGEGSESRRERYLSGSVLSGLHLGSHQDFDGVDIESEFLDGWIDRQLWEHKQRTLKMIALPMAREAAYQHAKISLYFGTTESHGQKKWSITRRTTLSVQPADAMLINDCAHQVQHFDSLMDVIFACPTSASKVIVTKPGAQVFPNDGMRLSGTTSEPRFSDPRGRVRFVTDCLCSFQDFGGLEGVAK